MPGSPIRLRKNKNDNTSKQTNKPDAAGVEKPIPPSSLDELYNRASLGTKIVSKDNSKQMNSSPVNVVPKNAVPKNVQKETKDIGMKKSADNKVVSKHDNAANKKSPDTNINKPISNTNKSEPALNPDKNIKPVKNTNTDNNKVIKSDKEVNAEKQSSGVFSIDKEQENLRNKIMNIPDDIAPYLILEDWRDFESSRYYLTPDLEKIYNDIVNIQKIIPEIHDMGLGYLNSTLLYGPPGTGKAQPLYSKILTPDGFRRMGDLKIGDCVTTPTGNFAKIIGIFPQGKRPIYEFTLSNGKKTRASDSHLWEVRENGNDIKVVTTDYIRLLRTHCISIEIPVYFQDDSGKNYVKIRSIRYIGEEECQCIYIDDPSHLYITDDYIITHNTTFARYIAYKLQIPYAYISFNKLMEGIMGNTSRNINRIFKFMADQQCVFTLDEIDCIATRRGKEAEATGGELSRITITIMQELDYYRRHKVDSIIIGATNRKDMLDAALLSRFAIKHEVRPLKMKEKEEYMAGFLRDINVPFDMQNIREYCRDNSTLSQRGLEQDMTRCVAVWLMNNKEKPYIVDHIDEEGGAR